MVLLLPPPARPVTRRQRRDPLRVVANLLLGCLLFGVALLFVLRTWRLYQSQEQLRVSRRVFAYRNQEWAEVGHGVLRDPMPADTDTTALPPPVSTAEPVPRTANRSLTIGTKIKNLADPAQVRTPREAILLLEQYARLHGDMMSGKVHEPRALVVHFHADAGLANRVGVLVSALALAITTDRALLVDWPPVQAHWHPSREYIALPSLGDLFQLPPSMSWSWQHARKWLPTTHGSSCEQRAGQQQSDCLDLQTPGSPDFGSLLCGRLEGGGGEGPAALAARVAHLQSWDYFLPLLRSNPDAAPILSSLGPHPGSVLARWLLQPIEPLEERAVRFAETHLAGRFAVGIHIRNQGYNGLTTIQVKALAACAAAVTAAQGVDASAVVWFVASDSQQGRAIVARHAASHGIPVVHMNSPLGGAEWRGSTRGTQAALVELRVLALCDEIVLSPGSTFGRAASMWAAKDPHVLLKEGSRAGTCPRKGDVDGCCHSWRDSLLPNPPPGGGGGGYGLPVPRLKRAAWSCMTPEHLKHMARYHSDCRAS